MRSSASVDAKLAVSELASRRERWALGQTRATWIVLGMLAVTVCAAVLVGQVGPQSAISEIQVPESLGTALRMAGSGGTGHSPELAAVFEQLDGFASGYMVKALAVAMLLTGLAVGVTKQSIMAPIVGISTACTLALMPSMLDSMGGDSKGRSLAVIAQEAIERHDAVGLRSIVADLDRAVQLEGEFVLAQMGPRKGEQPRQSQAKAVLAKLAGQKAFQPRADVLYALEKSAYGAAQSDSAKTYSTEREGRVAIAHTAAWALATMTATATAALGAWLLVSFLIARRIRRIRELLAAD